MCNEKSKHDAKPNLYGLEQPNAIDENGALNRIISVTMFASLAHIALRPGFEKRLATVS